MDIRLIAFDLDGTLLRPDKTIAPRTMQALRAAQEKGVLLVPATGRLFRSLPEELKDVSLARYLILTNGAQVYDNALQKTLAREDMTAEQAMRILTHLSTYNVIRGVYVDGLGSMSKDDFAQIDEVVSIPATIRVMRNTYRTVDDVEAFVKGVPSVQKIIGFFRDVSDKQPAIAEMTRLFPDYAISSSIFNNVEINAKSATKGNALRSLCQTLGLSTAQCMAFGDDTNDCSMLQEAGLGVAMGNAAEAVKACANAVTETNEEDGVAQMIERTLGL